MSLLEQEKSTLQEKNNNLNMELASANVEYERLKRESQARQEQDKSNINSLQSELKNFRSQFEQTWYVHSLHLNRFTSKEDSSCIYPLNTTLNLVHIMGKWFFQRYLELLISPAQIKMDILIAC